MSLLAPAPAPLRPHVRRILAVTAAIFGLIAVGVLQSASAEAKVRRGPAGLAFYHPPKHLPARHGTLIWARKARGIVRLSNARWTRLVLYSSRTPQGKRDAVSGSVSVPKGRPPKGGWRVITYAHGTTGVADVCAPSRNRQGGPAQPYISYVDPQLNQWLKAGYAVVRTDYQGLGTPGKHPYLIGKAEGRSVLDIVRAARQLDPRIGRRFLIAGHSQGGQAALFAGGEAKGWVPRLKLRGTVAFAPASHILDQASLLPALTSPSPLTALATLIVDGASTQSKQIRPGQLLSDPVLSLYPLLQKQCLSRLSAADELGGIAPSTILRSGADITAFDAVLARENPLVRMAAPILIAQGESDTTVFPFYTGQLNGELVGVGDQVTYKTYPGVDHGSIVSVAEPDALAFFEQQLPPHG